MQNVMISIHSMTPSSTTRSIEDGKVQDSNVFISGHDKKWIPQLPRKGLEIKVFNKIKPRSSKIIMKGESMHIKAG